VGEPSPSGGGAGRLAPVGGKGLAGMGAALYAFPVSTVLAIAARPDADHSS
jgi:hypothetical protein